MTIWWWIPIWFTGVNWLTVLLLKLLKLICVFCSSDTDEPRYRTSLALDILFGLLYSLNRSFHGGIMPLRGLGDQNLFLPRRKIKYGRRG
jgi:hypothetical protein